jgi:hypothetical protein
MAYDQYSVKAKAESGFIGKEFEEAVREFKDIPGNVEAASILTGIGNPFRSYELAEQLGLDSYEVKDMIHFLSRYKMIKTLPAGYRKLPKMNSFLRALGNGGNGHGASSKKAKSGKVVFPN